MNTHFDHEKLKVYQDSLKFAAWCLPLLDRLPKSYSVRDQLERARISIPLNIAEGNGKFTAADRCRYFDNARGSTLESAACIDLLMIDGHIEPAQAEEGKSNLRQIVSMLVGLIKSNSPDRFHEEATEYRIGEQEQD